MSTPDSPTAFWDARYAAPFSSYGTVANDFVRATAASIPDGPVLVLAAGEGRDAVYLAERGHAVTAMDLSAQGLENAVALAKERNVDLTTVVGDLATYDMGTARWAGIVAIWAHVPPPLRHHMHTQVVRALMPGGVYIFESYAPRHLELPGVGGPPNLELLVTPAQALHELEGLDLLVCQHAEREVQEGEYHRGLSATTQVLGFRPLD